MIIDLSNIPGELVSFDAVEGIPMVDLPKAVADTPPEPSTSPELPGNEAVLQVNQEIVTLMGETLEKVFKDCSPVDVYIAMKFWAHVFEQELEIKGVEFN